ncbi:MAG: VWA domain-containing protein [Trichodesmium sp. MAG_R04]|nr:VWA domain-containing protein [Trichodesmium sp. MAG_R04]
MALPGGAISNRPLHFIWLCDCSGSMSINGKIEVLNRAIRESLPEMKRVANDNPNANVLVRAIKFSDSAQWHVPTETPVNSFNWTDLTAGGLTDMGKALLLLAEQLKMPPMTDRALPPVLVLISDGQPTDDFDTGLRALMNEPWGKKAVRIAIAVGQDADKDTLQKFINHPELRPLEANNAETLVRYIKWASTAVLKAASSPVSQMRTPGKTILSNPTTTTTTTTTRGIPIPTVVMSSSGDDDVW